jgi:adenosylcobinamide-phosphate synthase
MTSFLAVLLALVIEQLKPLPRDNQVHRAMRGWGGWARRNLDAGGASHAIGVWAVTVLLPAALVAAFHQGLAHYSLLAALAFDVVILYLTLGFRQFSHYFTDIRDALDRGDEAAARLLLARWQGVETADLPRTELLRHVIEHSLLAAHRHVLGVFFCFIVLSAIGLGPAGAVLYRMAAFLRDQTVSDAREPGAAVNARLLGWSRSAFDRIDHLPSRLTAFGFAVVGNFEEAINGWRRDASLWPDRNEGILLSAAAGATGVALGGAAAPSRGGGVEGTAPAPDASVAGSTPGEPARPAHLQSMAALVWRSVVLWLLIVALLSLANVIGN